MTRLAEHQAQSHEMTKEIATAQQHKKINEAATAYIQQHANQLQSVTNATTPAIITVPMLQAANVNLPASFNPTNPFGQTWQVQVLQPTAGNLQALSVAVGGTPLSDLQASRLAKLMGYAGGFVPRNDSGIYAQGMAYGAFASWNISTSGYSGITGGRPAALMTFNNGQLASNYLYRNAVPGQPQLNRMNTALDMGGNDINQANTLNANTVSASGDIHGENAHIRGNATADTLRANSRLSTGEFVQIEGIATENAPCSQNGLVGRDTVGALLSCQAGVWTSFGQRGPYNNELYGVTTGYAGCYTLPSYGKWAVYIGSIAYWSGSGTSGAGGVYASGVYPGGMRWCAGHLTQLMGFAWRIS